MVTAERLAVSWRDMAGIVATLHTRLAERDPQYREPARRLFRLLLGRVESDVVRCRRLVIVPDGLLWEVPFQALLSSGNRYLTEYAAISYAPSLTVLWEMRRVAAERLVSNDTRRPFAAVAAGALGEEPLADTERQARLAALVYGAGRGTLYLGRDATERRIRQEGAAFRVLHVASHGVLNNERPLDSFVALSRTPGDPADDGRLHARELMTLDLRADLVVLSACETARGRVGAGEGVIGMTWALLVAGATSTVVSQWKVDADAASKVLLVLHRGLESAASSGAPLPAARALRHASLVLLRERMYRHPFYWAAFVVVGDGG
jgi:CHAT domain-containing protein